MKPKHGRTHHDGALPRRERLLDGVVALHEGLLLAHREERLGEFVEPLIRLPAKVTVLERAEGRLHVHRRVDGW